MITVVLSHRLKNECEQLTSKSERVMSAHMSLACVVCHTHILTSMKGVDCTACAASKMRM